MPTPLSSASRSQDLAIHVLAVVLALTIFMIDVSVPLGSAVGMLYVGVILLGLWTRWRPF